MQKVKGIVRIALAGIAAAMGIAVVVLGILGAAPDTQTQLTLLGIGVFALGLLALQGVEKK